MRLNLLWPQAAEVHPPGRAARQGLWLLCGVWLLVALWAGWQMRGEAERSAAQLAALRGQAADLSAKQRRLLPDERAWAHAQAAQSAAWALAAQSERMRGLWALLDSTPVASGVHLSAMEFSAEEAVLSGSVGSEQALTAWMQALGMAAVVDRVQLHELSAQTLAMADLGAQLSYRFRLTLQLVPAVVPIKAAPENPRLQPPQHPTVEDPSAGTGAPTSSTDRASTDRARGDDGLLPAQGGS